jgi:hypothetical protein
MAFYAEPNPSTGKKNPGVNLLTHPQFSVRILRVAAGSVSGPAMSK